MRRDSVSATIAGVGLIAVIALSLVGCASPSPSDPTITIGTPAPEATPEVSQDNDSAYWLSSGEIHLRDGRTIVCILATQSLSCDWEHGGPIVNGQLVTE